MADVLNDFCKGRWIHLSTLPLGTDTLLVVLLKSTSLPTDNTLKRNQFLSAVLASGTGAGIEADFTNYCVDPETECLTKRLGWTRYDELLPTDEVLAYDQDGHVTRWETLDGIYVNPSYEGSMWRLSMRGFSAVTTPNHRWPLIRTRRPELTPNYRTVTTETLPPRTVGDWSLLRSAPFESHAESTYSDEFVRIAAWYFTEGSLIRGGKSVTFSQSPACNLENVENIRRDLKTLGAVAPDRPRVCTSEGCDRPVANLGMCDSHYRHEYRKGRKAGNLNLFTGRRRSQGLFVTERERKSDGLLTWDLFGTDVDLLTEAVFGFDKVPTAEFLSALTPSQAAMFVDVCIAADGTPATRRFDQHNVDRMNAFMFAAVLAGTGPTLGAAGTSCHLNERSPHARPANLSREEFQYSGTVWCPTLPSGYWVARRDGKVHITGNSRKVVSASDITVTVNTTTDVVTLDISDQVWNAAGGATNNTLGALLLCYKPTSISLDTAIPILTKHTFSITTTGGNLTATIPSIGTST